MCDQKLTGASITGTGQLVSQPCVVCNLGLLAGADAATALFYDGTSAIGTPLKWGLGAGTGLGDNAQFDCLRFKNGVYVSTTGTTPRVFVTICQPKSSA